MLFLAKDALIECRIDNVEFRIIYLGFGWDVLIIDVRILENTSAILVYFK